MPEITRVHELLARYADDVETLRPARSARDDHQQLRALIRYLLDRLDAIWDASHPNPFEPVEPDDLEERLDFVLVEREVVMVGFCLVQALLASWELYTIAELVDHTNTDEDRRLLAWLDAFERQMRAEGKWPTQRRRARR
jgi:hypothetical protein